MTQRKLVILSYTLSMPNPPSWDGKWSGEGKLYCIVRRYPQDQGALIRAYQPYSYRWKDGWHALIRVEAVNATEARRLRKESVGFAGYEWMIDSIEQHGRIIA